MSVDILGTNCDQCRSTVQYYFTSTETIRLVRTESPGRPPRLYTAPQLWPFGLVSLPLSTPTRCPNAHDAHLQSCSVEELLPDRHQGSSVVSFVGLSVSVHSDPATHSEEGVSGVGRFLHVALVVSLWQWADIVFDNYWRS